MHFCTFQYLDPISLPIRHQKQLYIRFQHQNPENINEQVQNIALMSHNDGKWQDHRPLQTVLDELIIIKQHSAEVEAPTLGFFLSR